LDANSLWNSFAEGDGDAREALLAEHLGLVHFVARQLSRKLSSEADFDELLSAGTLGLIGAMESFDLSRGLAFSTFAAPRIRGAILDELRRQDHVSRSVRRKARELGAAREELAHVLGRPPADRELAIRLNMDIPKVWRWESEIEGAVMVSLEGRPGDHDDRFHAPADTLFDASPSIDEILDQEERVALLAHALTELGEQDRTVLTLNYYEGLKLHEIATVLGVTESRVSQIRAKALARLRGAMAPRLAAVA
jgi:RNA polymerase sigma factor for flagellar operon FliA